MKYHYITRPFIVLLKGLVIFEDDRDDRPRVHTPGAFFIYTAFATGNSKAGGRKICRPLYYCRLDLRITYRRYGLKR